MLGIVFIIGEVNMYVFFVYSVKGKGGLYRFVFNFYIRDLKFLSIECVWVGFFGGCSVV